MDILNWLYLAKNKFVRTTLGSTKDLMIFGAKVGTSKRGDLYQNYAMSAEDFTTEVSNVVKPYKVYTALLTQNGGDNIEYINWDNDPNTLTIGVTYTITQNEDNTDFIPVGAPNNNVGTSFVATGTVVNWPTGPSTGNNQLSFNTGAPVVTVLENTLGFNPTWNILIPGFYFAHLYDTQEIGKVVTCNIGTVKQNGPGIITEAVPSISFDDGSDLPDGTNFTIITDYRYVDASNPLIPPNIGGPAYTDVSQNVLDNYLIEIRVYN